MNMYTSSGRFYDPMFPASIDFNLKDIAHSLSLLCRFNGHVKQFYSVAEHCVLVKQYLSRTGAAKDVQRQGLLHDAAEAYYGDVPTPVKRFVPEHRVREKEALALLLKRYKLPSELDDQVHQADRVLLATEAIAFMHPTVRFGEGSPLVKPCGWKPQTAERIFLSTARHLGLE